MPSRHRWFFPLLALLTLPCAALEWKATQLSITTAPFQATQDVTFEFKNSGPKPVAILDLQTNCDCLAADADRKVYAPGESGHIKAQFTIGDRSGLYERVVTVVTDESPTPVRLLVKIEVPELFAVSPRSVLWKQNAPATEQVVDVTPAAGLEITFTEAQPTNPAFTAYLETVEPGRRYRLHLQPVNTATPASAAIRIFGQEKSGHKVVASAYATVE
jgi:hypothetical protein